MKSLFISFISVTLISLYGCQTTTGNYSQRDSLGSQKQETVREAKNIDKSPESTTVAENTPVESKNVPETKTAAVHNATVRTSPDKKTFGGWEVECGSAETDCSAILRVKTKNGNQIFGLMVKEEGKDVKPVVTAWLPLGIYLPAPVRVYLGESDTPFLFAPQFCWSEGCLAASDAPDAVVAALNKPGSGKISVSMVEYNTKKLKTFSFSQNGFQQAYQYIVNNR